MLLNVSKMRQRREIESNALVEEFLIPGEYGAQFHNVIVIVSLLALRSLNKINQDFPTTLKNNF